MSEPLDIEALKAQTVEAHRALHCLLLEVHADVHRDIATKIGPILDALPALIEVAEERDRLRARIADAAGVLEAEVGSERWSEVAAKVKQAKRENDRLRSRDRILKGVERLERAGCWGHGEGQTEPCLPCAAKRVLEVARAALDKEEDA